MIPRCYPTVYATANGKTQMVVNILADVTGLKEWIDYIPVKNTVSPTINSYNNDGAIEIYEIPSTTGKQAGKDYINVYEDAAKTVAWSSNNNGYIPIYYTAP